MAYALQLSEKWSAGIQLDYIAGVFPENVRHKGFATFETGVIYRPADKLHFGAHLFNPVKGGIQTLAGKQEMPVTFRAGGNYRFGEMVLFAFEAEKENKNPALVKAGIEFCRQKTCFCELALQADHSNTPQDLAIKRRKFRLT